MKGERDSNLARFRTTIINHADGRVCEVRHGLYGTAYVELGKPHKKR